jgi:hypothetical protein
MVTRAKLVRAIPVAVGLLVVLAGFAKAAKPDGLNTALLQDGVSPLWVSSLALLVIQVEVLLGTAMTCRVGETFTVRAAIFLFTVFTVQLGYFATFKEPPSCGCLGAIQLFESARAEAVFGIVRNTIIVAALLVVHRRRHRLVEFAR